MFRGGATYVRFDCPVSNNLRCGDRHIPCDAQVNAQLGQCMQEEEDRVRSTCANSVEILQYPNRYSPLSTARHGGGRNHPTGPDLPIMQSGLKR